MSPRALLMTVLAAGIAACLAGAPAGADQTDPDLNALFEQLQRTTDAADAEAIQQQIWTRWIDTDKPDRGGLMAAGILSMSSGRLRDALAAFNALSEMAPDYAEAWNKRATVRFMLGDLAGSVEDIERTLKLEPRHFGALSGLGMILTDIEQYEGAIKAYERALAVNPFSTGARQQIELLRRKLKDKET